MKNKFVFAIILLLSTIALTFYGCEEKVEYDFDNIEPIIFSIAGPAVATAHGNTDFPTRFSVPYRGGSKFNWQVGAPGGTVVLDPEYPSIAYITFNQSPVNTTAVVTVTETTMGGRTSPPFSRTIQLNAFCPVNMADWAGTYTGTRPGVHGASVTMAPAPGLNQMTVSGLAWFVQNAWGENWLAGNGSAIMEFRCGNEVAILPQWIGNTDFPDRYGITGSGTFDPVTRQITLTYQVFWGWVGATGPGGGSAVGSVTTVLTRQ